MNYPHRAGRQLVGGARADVILGQAVPRAPYFLSSNAVEREIGSLCAQIADLRARIHELTNLLGQERDRVRRAESIALPFQAATIAVRELVDQAKDQGEATITVDALEWALQAPF